MIPVSVNAIPIPVPLGRISIPGFPKIHDSNSNSNSDSSSKWFRFWFQLQNHLILFPIPIPLFCELNDSNSISGSSDID